MDYTTNQRVVSLHSPIFGPLPSDPDRKQRKPQPSLRLRWDRSKSIHYAIQIPPTMPNSGGGLTDGILADLSEGWASDVGTEVSGPFPKGALEDGTWDVRSSEFHFAPESNKGKQQSFYSIFQYLRSLFRFGSLQWSNDSQKFIYFLSLRPSKQVANPSGPHEDHQPDDSWSAFPSSIEGQEVKYWGWTEHRRLRTVRLQPANFAAWALV